MGGSYIVYPTAWADDSKLGRKVMAFLLCLINSLKMFLLSLISKVVNYNLRDYFWFFFRPSWEKLCLFAVQGWNDLYFLPVKTCLLTTQKSAKWLAFCLYVRLITHLLHKLFIAANVKVNRAENRGVLFKPGPNISQPLNVLDENYLFCCRNDTDNRNSRRAQINAELWKPIWHGRWLSCCQFYISNNTLCNLSIKFNAL